MYLSVLQRHLNASIDLPPASINKNYESIIFLGINIFLYFITLDVRLFLIIYTTWVRKANLLSSITSLFSTVYMHNIVPPLLSNIYTQKLVLLTNRAQYRVSKTKLTNIMAAGCSNQARVSWHMH